MTKNIRLMFLNALPVFLMVGLIPYIKNDYQLAFIYLLIAGVSLVVRYYPKDLMALILGFFIMIISEYTFVQSGVENFNRQTFLGIMPIWLPILWSYSFMVIKRYIVIILGYDNFLIRIMSVFDKRPRI